VSPQKLKTNILAYRDTIFKLAENSWQKRLDEGMMMPFYVVNYTLTLD
jgi:hypothetical protein